MTYAARDSVRRSPDLDRVLALPSRPQLDPSSPRAAALVDIMTSRLARRRSDPCSCRRCIKVLMPSQAQALWEMRLAGGLLGPIGVGQGKTGLDVLAAMVVPDCRLAAVLIPPGRVEQFVGDYLAWSEHFETPSLVVPGQRGSLDRGWIKAGRPVLHVVTYSRFSRAESTDLLDRLAPDLVVADEAHMLKCRESARTRRVLRYFAEHPSARLCAWSGTLTTKSLRDFAHLAAFALGEGSPLPLDPDEVEAWAAAVDPSDWPASPGALRSLARAGETVRGAVRRRVVETRGVVSAESASGVGASLSLRERVPPPVPDAVASALREVAETWARPDGEEFVDALSVAKCLRELACGFYYRWRFPGHPDPKAVDAWRDARRAWHRELREKLKAAAPHLDSPLLCARAAIRAYQDPPYAGELPTWRAASWPRWRDLRDSVAHVTESVWVDDWLARDAAAWVRDSRGVAWYAHNAFGRRVAELAGLPLHSGGEGAEAAILAESGDRSVVASIQCHGHGLDGLQRAFSEQLVANSPSSGAAWEQLLGRLHRPGQEADEVVTHVYRHTRAVAEHVDRAVEQAKYVQDITGSRQKLLCCDVEWARHDAPVPP